MKKQNIKIDSEFKSLIPSLAPDEFEQLEKNILDEGCRDDIVVWRTKTADDEIVDIIVDGHNRYEICTKHDVGFNITQAFFASRDEAKIWIYDNQFGRRNISDVMKIELALRKAELLKPLAKKNQSLSGGDKKSEKALLTETSKAINEPINIRKIVADNAGVSEDTVRKFTKIKESGNDKLLEQVKSGEKKIGTAYKEVTDAKKTKKHEPEIIDVDYVEVTDTTTTNIVDSLKYQAESEYMLYRDMLDRATTEEEREDIIAKYQGLSGRSEYVKIQRMIKIRDILESKGLNHNYLDNYLNAVHGSNNITTLLATYVKAKVDVGEDIDPVNISADVNIIEEATQELVAITTAYHNSISSFNSMDGLIEKMDVDILKDIRRKMEWTLDAIGGFFDKANNAIDD